MQGILFHKALTQTATADAEHPGRGRSAVLIERRNEKICYRYYFKARHQRIRSYEQIIEELSAEFDLSTATLGKMVVTVLADRLKGVFQEQPSIRTLKARFPHLVWH